MSGNVPREPVYCELVLADWVERVSHRAERDSTSSPHDLHPVGKCRLSAIPSSWDRPQRAMGRKPGSARRIRPYRPPALGPLSGAGCGRTVSMAHPRSRAAPAALGGHCLHVIHTPACPGLHREAVRSGKSSARTQSSGGITLGRRRWQARPAWRHQALTVCWFDPGWFDPGGPGSVAGQSGTHPYVPAGGLAGHRRDRRGVGSTRGRRGCWPGATAVRRTAPAAVGCAVPELRSAHPVAPRRHGPRLSFATHRQT